MVAVHGAQGAKMSEHGRNLAMRWCVNFDDRSKTAKQRKEKLRIERVNLILSGSVSTVTIHEQPAARF